jgi:hypothetical protein
MTERLAKFRKTHSVVRPERTSSKVWSPVLAAVALLCICLKTPSLAQVPVGLPDYDPEKFCKKQSATVGGGNFLLKACLEQEQEAYDQIKAQWASLDKKTTQQCRQMANLIGGSYFMLHACIEQELASAEEVGKFKFKK